MFQAVGVPANAAPQAPPDNVLLLPSDQWHRLFDPQAHVRPDSVRTQLHVRLVHDLAADPEGAAYSTVIQRAHNFEARIAGTATVGDNLSARLLGVRADALYARVLFLFLGAPGIVLAVLLTFAAEAATSGTERRRREQALLRVRGASHAQILRLEALEAVVVGVVGAAAGVLVSIGALWLMGSAARLDAAMQIWLLIAAGAGVVLGVAAMLVPAWRQLRQPAWSGLRIPVGRQSTLWQRLYLDVLFLAGSAVAFWQMASTGYQVVLAPEGVSQSSSRLPAFLAPVLLWLGSGLLAIRLCDRGLARGRALLAWAARPLAGRLAEPVSASLHRPAGPGDARRRTGRTGGLICNFDGDLQHHLQRPQSRVDAH